MADMALEDATEPKEAAPIIGEGETTSDTREGYSVTTSGPSVTAIVTAVSGLGLSAYVIAVALQGNIQQLWTLLLSEENYLEFLIAIIIIWALMKYGPTSPITDLLVVGAVAAVAFKLAGTASLEPALSNFAAGKATMLQTVQSIFGQNKIGA